MSNFNIIKDRLSLKDLSRNISTLPHSPRINLELSSYSVTFEFFRREVRKHTTDFDMIGTSHLPILNFRADIINGPA